MQNEEYLDIEANIGLNCRTKKCICIHPSELYMIYAVGALVVVKSVDDQKDKFLKGHTSSVSVLTVSKGGSLIASGETHDLQSQESGALIIWDFATLDILYRVRFHKQMIQALSFSCDERVLASVGGARDGNQLVLWNMNEGKSEVFMPASNELNQECTDISFYNNDPNKLISVHQNAVKIWSFDPKTKKLNHYNCALGKLKRFITCVAIDNIDEHAYCGTRSGDILEISLVKGIYSRSGPIDKKISGTVNQVVSLHINIYAGSSSG